MGVLPPLSRGRHHRHHVVRPEAAKRQGQKAPQRRLQASPRGPHRVGQCGHRQEVGVRLPIHHLHLQERKGRVGGGAVMLEDRELARSQVKDSYLLTL